jgi:lactate dehydrogenase-like 2-hydroxyacid dehydrogenase
MHTDTQDAAADASPRRCLLGVYPEAATISQVLRDLTDVVTMQHQGVKVSAERNSMAETFKILKKKFVDDKDPDTDARQ